ncbi:MAG: hypothetical protein EYC70_03470 [Planctomycetota bacterium]|nr:MAG: hypothetical protein EYC70_03470 [Planctomycetota bacterium]
MPAGFYGALALALLAGAGACGGEAPPPAASAGHVFPLGPLPPQYQPPPDGDFVPRHLEHMLYGGRDALHYAQGRLAEAGPAAVPALMQALEPKLRDERYFAHVVSLCQALGRCGDPQTAPLLLRVVQEAPVPVCRSSALEALQELAAEGVAAHLVPLLSQETEIAVRQRLIEALGVLGGPEAADCLEALVVAAVRAEASEDARRDGTLAWNSLLLLRDAGALARLQRLSDLVGPLLRLQALIVRAELGETGLTAAIAEHLDAQRFPSGQLRATAVDALAAAGAWNEAVRAAADPDPKVRRAVARSLRSPSAPPAEAAALLQALAHDTDPGVMEEALRSLVARDDRRELEPWLRALAEFPLGAGSTDALNLLADPGLADPRTSAVLLRRWRYCDATQRVDVVRALGALGDPAAAEYLGRVLVDPEEERGVRQAAAVALANFGAAGLEPLLRAARAGMDVETAAAVLPSLASLARRHAAAADYLSALAADTGAQDAARRMAMDLLPKALGEGAVAPLLRARDAEARTEVRGYLDGVLRAYF